MASIKINNAFNNSPTFNGVILTCNILEGKVETGDEIVLEGYGKLLISETQRFDDPQDIAVTIYQNSLTTIPNLKVYQLIGKAFRVQSPIT